MTGTVEIKLGDRPHLLRFNNYSVDVMRKQLLSIVPVGDKRKPEEVINDIVGQSDMLALQTIIYSGMCGNSLPQFKLPEATIQQVGEWLAELTPEEMTSMWQTVEKTRNEANGPKKKGVKKAKA